VKSTRKLQKRLPAESIARKAEQGRDVSRFFTNTGRMMKPIQSVNLDLPPEMLQGIDQVARKLDIRR
jgi:hypothetical protein